VKTRPVALLLAFALELAAAQPVPPSRVPPLPEPRQLHWQEQEYYGFLHFGINTFTDKEWGYGDEPESLFVPGDFDADQIVRTAIAAGMSALILTAKHHDGFCLWPSRFTEHSVKNSPWRNGRGDVVREISDACGRYGLRFGIYLSPWDCNHALYGRPEYVDYFRAQLRELLTNYGPIAEVWFDGANGGRGYYGGTREVRTIDRSSYYGWNATWELVRKLQPNAVIFSDVGPDVRWVGNEEGYANETCWSTYSPVNEKGGAAFPGEVRYVDGMSGHRDGTSWMPAECDVSIRPGWFYHAREDTLVKTPAKLFELYLRSVGRNGSLLLNIPPDRRGRIALPDSLALVAFRRLRDAAFSRDLAREGTADAASVLGNDPRCAPAAAIDKIPSSYWAAQGSTPDVWLSITLLRPERISCAVLREPIALGQRIESFLLEVPDGQSWRQVAAGTTIGNKRIITFPAVETKQIRLRILGSKAIPLVSSFELFDFDPGNLR
jgi:alpha-L-fucosidase